MKTFVFYAKKCVSDYCCTFYFMLTAILMMSISSYGQAITGVVPVQTPLGGSGVDGDALAHTPATIPGYVGSTTGVGDLFDMVHPTGTHGVLDLTTGNLLYPGFTYFLQDPYVDDKTIFTLSNKINDNPNTYTWGPGSSPNKNEIQNCGAHFSYGEPSLGGLSTDLWCLFAGDRQVTNGSSYIDFEFLQKSLTITGAEFGTFNPQTGTTPITGGSGSFLSLGTDGGRTVGDLLVTIEFVQGGGAASISIRKWEAVGAGFEYVIHPNSEFIGEVFITNNTSPTSVPFDVYGTNPGTYVVNQWAEGAVNLTQLFAQDPCFAISTLFIRTRSSGNSDQSELKDFPGAPIQLELNFIPDAPTVTSVTRCGPGVVNLSAGGCPGGTLKWYDAATLGNLVNTGPTFSPNITSTTSYWVSCTNSRGCEGPRTQVTGTVNNVVPGTIAGDQTLCTPFNPAEFTSTTPGSGSGVITYQWQMSTTGCGSGFADIVGATSATYDAGAVAVITYFRRVTTSTVNNVPCSDNSNCLTVTPNAISPGEIAGSQTLCTPFNPAAFTSTTPGSGGGAITYQWQMSTTGCGSGFTDIVGATSATYDAPAVAVVTYFRRVATSTLNGVPCSDNSNCLTVTPNAINPGEIAGSQTLCTPFNPAAFTSTTPGSGDGAITYQWQMSTTGCGSGFADIVGATSATYDAPAVAVITYFRRVATSTVNGVPCSDNSNCLTVTPNAINPGEIAGSQTLCTPFNPAAFTSTTPGSGGGAITYQWQMSTTGCGSGFADIVGATSATYDAPAVAVVTYFRRVATSTLNGVPCSDNSNCLTVTPNDITPGVIAGNQTICSGGNPAAFTNTTPGSTTGGGTITYQWQSGEGTCATATFANIVGATSATYDVPAGLSVTTSYRRVATSTINGVPCSDNSNCITVTVINVTPGTIAASQTICSGGNPAAFTETAPAGGSNLTYQWQSGLGTCDTATFSNIVGATSATYDPPTGLMATTSYRRVVNSTDAECPAISNCITVTVNDISPGTIAGSQTLCTPFNPAEFTSTTPGSGGGTITYQWQMSTTGCGSGFADIVGATSATYDAPAVAVVTYFRRVAISTLNGTPCSDNSNCLTVTPNAINPGVIAGSQTLCAPFDPMAFTSTTPGSGDGAITYQWQMSTTGCGSGFADIVGATSATYDAPAVAVVTYFRRVATSTLNGVPCSDNSNCLTVTPESINPGEIAGSQTLCAPFDPVAFTSVTPGSNGGVITYQWQMSTTNCDSGFTDIVGATSATYDAPAVTVTTYFRRVATSTLNGTPCYDNSNCLTVTASPSPILMITNPQSVCSPLTVDLTAAAVTAGSTLYGATLSYWQDPAATIALANPNAVAMSGTYYIKATTTDGCFDIEPVSVLIESCDQEGCTLGYWKNHTDRWCPAYTPSMLFGSVFVNAPSELASLTLLEALNLGGGNIYNLARQGVAALLNACSDEVAYPAPYGNNPQLVIDAVNAAYLTGGKAPGRLATQLDILNNSGCPLGGTPATSAIASEGPEEADFTMYPIPFREEITIRYNFDYKTNARIEISDAVGNLMITYDDPDAYFNEEVTLSPKLNHGDVQLFFVKVITNKGFTVKKVISTK